MIDGRSRDAWVWSEPSKWLYESNRRTMVSSSKKLDRIIIRRSSIRKSHQFVPSAPEWSVVCCIRACGRIITMFWCSVSIWTIWQSHFWWVRFTTGVWERWRRIIGEVNTILVYECVDRCRMCGRDNCVIFRMRMSFLWFEITVLDVLLDLMKGTESNCCCERRSLNFVIFLEIC